MLICTGHGGGGGGVGSWETPAGVDVMEAAAVLSCSDINVPTAFCEEPDIVKCDEVVFNKDKALLWGQATGQEACR